MYALYEEVLEMLRWQYGVSEVERAAMYRAQADGVAKRALEEYPNHKVVSANVRVFRGRTYIQVLLVQGDAEIVN